jgi:tetratricopeptide (TPR) repeat protein
MRCACLVAGLLLTLRCFAYDLTGRIEPPAAMPVFLHGATAPSESATESDAAGRFRFHKISAGTYTLAIATAARGQALETIELSPGTVDSKGRLDVVLRIDDSRLESEGVRGSGATVSATVLSIPDRAMREYEEAQRCLTRREADRASAHLARAVELAPQFVAAWNQLGVMAYQARRYSDAEARFRRALDADPEAFEPLVNLGGVLLNLERPQEALVYNQRAATRRPNNALANSQLGLTYFDLDNPDLAEKYLKTAIQLDPAHFSHPQLTLAEIYVRRGDRASALGQLRGFLEQHPDSPQAAVVRQEIAELQ